MFTDEEWQNQYDKLKEIEKEWGLYVEETEEIIKIKKSVREAIDLALKCDTSDWELLKKTKDGIKIYSGPLNGKIT